MEPYRHLLSTAMLAEARDLLGEALTTHPVLSSMLEQLREDPQVHESGEVAKEADGSSKCDEPDGAAGASGAAG